MNTIIEKIRAEIERHKELFKEACDYGSFYACAMRDEAYATLEFLSDLEKAEKPSEGLEKEIHRYFNPHGMELQFDRSKGNTILKPEQLISFARHFAQWGAERLANPGKTSPNDLEEAAEEFAKDAYPDKHNLIWMFKRGANWQAEQDQETIELAEDHAYLAGSVNEREKMMKEAVEGEITKDNRGNNVVRAGVFNKDFEYGDKVRVIILPKEESK